MTTKPHKHADLIKAWADGAVIQYRMDDGDWDDVPLNKPNWYSDHEYRVQPEPPKYPQTSLTYEELVIAANGGKFSGLVPPPFDVAAVRIADAAIARAIHDKQVYLPSTGGEVVLLSDHNGHRIFMVDGEEHVPVSMLEKVALAIAEDCDLRMRSSTYQPINVAAIIASVKEGA